MSARTFRAPGRVNLIGEHTDYNGGFVMPAAIQFYTTVTALPRADRKLVLSSAQFPDRYEFSLDERTPGRNAWCDYPLGTAYSLEQAGYKLTGAELAFTSDVPIGAGLSSSAALEVSTALALATLSGHHIPTQQLAEICQHAESEHVGMKCGIMDQFISIHGKDDHAVLLDCRSLEYKAAPIPGHLRLVIANSKVKHELTGSAYNHRRRDCESAAAFFGKPLLRDVTPQEFAAREGELEPQIRRRARHVIGEIARTEQAGMALEAGDYGRFGELMYASHESLKTDYEVSCEELDKLVEAARTVEGVYGSRMTGAGFGGCTISLMEESAVPGFLKQVPPLYTATFGIQPDLYVCRPVNGAHEVLA
ncbi:MAG: galactokinase [Acidobacteria bacterium]|nr:galactokinase [Acidobacteriota bacterium]